MNRKRWYLLNDWCLTQSLAVFQLYHDYK